MLFPGLRVLKKHSQRNVVKKPVQVNNMNKTSVAKTSGRNALAEQCAYRFVSELTLRALLPNQSPVLGEDDTS